MLNLILFVLCGKQYTIDLVCLCSVENSTPLTLFVLCGKQYTTDLVRVLWKTVEASGAHAVEAPKDK